MQEHKNPITVLLLATAALVLCAVGILGFTTLRNIRASQEELKQTEDAVFKKQEELNRTLANLQSEGQKLETIHQITNGTTEDTLSQEINAEEISPAQDADPDTFSQANGHKIAIDPGHQGEWVDMTALEPNGPGSAQMKARCSYGTQGLYTGLTEYQLNLDVSLKLEKLLRDRGYEVYLTRTDNDANVSNMERAQSAAASGSEIYVRIHANGEEQHTQSGALTLCPSQQNPYVASLSEESFRLSQSILDSYCQATGFANLGVQYSDDMTGINWSTIPVTIIEMGFMTSEQDDYAMSDASFQDTMAQGIADGIDAYFAR